MGLGGCDSSKRAWRTPASRWCDRRRRRRSKPGPRIACYGLPRAGALAPRRHRAALEARRARRRTVRARRVAPRLHAMALRAVRRYEEAEAALAAYPAVPPQGRQRSDGPSTLLCELGRHDEAIAAYDRALELRTSPRRGRCWTGRPGRSAHLAALAGSRRGSRSAFALNERLPRAGVRDLGLAPVPDGAPCKGHRSGHTGTRSRSEQLAGVHVARGVSVSKWGTTRKPSAPSRCGRRRAGALPHLPTRCGDRRCCSWLARRRPSRRIARRSAGPGPFDGLTPIYKGLSLARLEMGRLNEALDVVKEGLSKLPDATSLLQAQAAILNNLGRGR